MHLVGICWAKALPLGACSLSHCWLSSRFRGWPGDAPYTPRCSAPKQISALWMGLEQPGHLACAGEMLLSPEHRDCKKVCLLASTLQLAIQRPRGRGAFHILMMKIGKARHGEMESLTHSRWSQDLMQALTPQCLITFLWASKVFS